jgi:GMP synthase-like glutamine amidotransferase
MRVLSVVHDDSPTGGGGLFERIVVERGDRLDRWFTANGDAPPADPGTWDAIMVFGGVQHPDSDSDHSWLADETAFIRAALTERVPLLGVCLGAQLVARAAGARVGPARWPEIGWHEVDVDEAAAGDPVLGVLPRRMTAFQWHYYGFEIPEGAVRLASSDAANQAYCIGDRAWGVQFHPEVDLEMLEDWFEQGGDELDKPLAVVRQETGRYLTTWNEHGRALCTAFLDTASGRAGAEA